MKNLNYSKIDQFTIIRQLQIGSTAILYQAQYNQINLVIKKFPLYKLTLAQNQYKMARSLNHPNICKVYGFRTKAIHTIQDGKSQVCIIIIMQYISNGQLFDFVEKKQGIPEIITRTYFHMLIQGIKYMHQKGIAHLDIKLENLLLDKNYNLKIADFGFSTSDQLLQNISLGTPGYMSPEVIKGEKFKSIQADLFSIGVVLFMMSTSLKPFKEAKQQDIYFYMLNNQKKRFWRQFSEFQLSNNFKDLIQKMLAQDINKRLKIDQIVNHPWYLQKILSKNELYGWFKNSNSNY